MSKTYPSWLKALALASALAAPIFLTMMVSLCITLYDGFQYYDFYDWEIIDGNAEAVSDNIYHVTLTLKNHSAYRISLYEYDIQVSCNNKRIDRISPASHDSRLLDSLKNPVLPAGQTTEYSFDIVLPKDAEFITLEYYGTSYARQDYLYIKEERNRVYSLDLQPEKQQLKPD